jgi:hypothetical protein
VGNKRAGRFCGVILGQAAPPRVFTRSGLITLLWRALNKAGAWLANGVACLGRGVVSFNFEFGLF